MKKYLNIQTDFISASNAECKKRSKFQIIRISLFTCVYFDGLGCNITKNWKMSLCKKTSKRDGADRFFYQDTFLLDFRALILLAVSNKNIARD